jgi:predicted extracellular nuclease
MTEAFGEYRIHIADQSNGSAIDGEAFDVTIASTNPRVQASEDLGGTLKVASFNVLNYITTIDDGINHICGGNQNLGCRGADSATELQRQQAKIVSALKDLDADIVGLIEIENTPGVSATQTLVDALNLASGKSYVVIGSGVVGTDAIKVDFIYDSDTVAAVGLPAVLDTPEFVNPFNASIPRNRPAIAQTFEELATGGVITVVNNHLKSKGSACGAGDDDIEQGSCNLTRTAAAMELANWLATDPTNSGDSDFLIIGDLNSYAMEDPIMALKDAGFTDLAQTFIGGSAYSYVFDGRWGTLDYAMANESLMSQVAGATVWHINADEPDAIDYDESFNPSAWYEDDSFRSSDHDPIVVGLDLIVIPENKEECKDSAWVDLSTAEGMAFKNQGDCIQYVLTGK